MPRKKVTDRVIKQLRLDNVKLSNRVSQLENYIECNRKKQVYKTFAIMLYDISQYYKLNIALDYPFNKAIGKIYHPQIGIEHYIDSRIDSFDLNNYKCLFFVSHLSHFDCIKDVIKDKSGVDGLVDSVIEFIMRQDIEYNLSKDDEDKVETWWNICC